MGVRGWRTLEEDQRGFEDLGFYGGGNWVQKLDWGVQDLLVKWGIWEDGSIFDLNASKLPSMFNEINPSGPPFPTKFDHTLSKTPLPGLITTNPP